MSKESGIYMICRISTGDCYVGQAIDIEMRWKKHRYALRKGTHRSKYLQRCWNKYGPEAFEFIVLEVILDPSVVSLTTAEQKWMDALRPVYNSCPAAGSWLGARHTEESKKKQSQARLGKRPPPMSEEHKRKIREANLGKKRGPLSDEHKAKMSASLSGRTHSEATRAKISASNKGKRKPPADEQVRLRLATMFLGRKHTEASIEKMRAARRNRPTAWKHTEESKAKIAEANRSRRHSPETLAKMSAAQSKRHAERRARERA